MKNFICLFVLSSVLTAAAGCGGGSGGTTLVGTWRRPQNGTEAEITLVFSGTAAAGTLSGVVIVTGAGVGGSCTDTTRFGATYAVSGSTLTNTVTPGSGTYARAGCTDPADDMAQMSLEDSDVAAFIAGLSGTMSVSATQLVIVAGATTTTFTRL